MNLAILTPWPHQPSGIADYAFDLVQALARIGQPAVVYTDLATGHPLRASDAQLRSHRQFPREAAQYDCVLFQMGNNPHFHLWMLPLIEHHGGVVHLHDVVLQHLLAWDTFRVGKVAEYLTMIAKWYGEAVGDEVRALLLAKTYPWETPVVTEIPLFEEVVQHADACVVHSEFARQRVSRAFPDKKTLPIPQLYLLPPATPAAARGRLRVGVFGGVQPNRQVEIVLRALAQASRSGASPVELVVVGEIAKASAGVRKLAKQLHHEKFTSSFRGRVQHSEFHSLLAACDLVISLRYPTMGETSAVVMKALQYGVPTIVTRIGWYAELPDIVRKVERETMLAELTQMLSGLLSEPRALADWGASCTEHACRALDVEQAARNYQRFLQRAASHHLVERQLAQCMLRTGLGYAEPAILKSIVARVERLLPR